MTWGHGHLWPPPPESGVWRVRRAYDDVRVSCFHAAVVGSGWVYEGPCRDTADRCIIDLRAMQAERRWLADREA